MKKKILALVLALTMCFGTTMTANAAMIVKNDMSALGTSNILDKNSTGAPKNTLQYVTSKFKIEYTQEDLDALKKIFDANLYAKAYPDVAAAYGNDREALWNHYVTHGIKEGRTQINSTFNVFAYISAYPDLRNAFGDDLMAYYVHYANNGINENRKLTTVDAATKAGITVTGLQGQVIARPAPIQVPDLSSYSVPSSVPKTDKLNDTPKTTTQPTETPKPTEAPSPSVAPTPTSVSPTEKPGCNHSYTIGEPIEDMPHMHYAKCEYCGEYAIREDGSKLPLECKYENSVCRDCNRACNHDNCDSVNDSYHNEICKACGGVIRSEDHQYTYTNEKAEDGTPIHKGTCSTCQNTMEGPCEFENNTCKICGYTHEQHEWVSDTGECKYCKVVCDHRLNNDGICLECGYHSDSTSGMFGNVPK